MTLVEPDELEDRTPVAHGTIVYLGPVAPHWELRVHYGDQKLLDGFWARVNARLLLLPKHDPQFRRNRERVNRDAERELIICDWDLGDDDAESTSTPLTPPQPERAVAEAPIEGAAEAPVEDAVAEVPIEDAAEAPVEDAVAEVPIEDAAEAPAEADAVEAPAEAEAVEAPAEAEAAAEHGDDQPEG